jgi:hypothetical protein
MARLCVASVLILALHPCAATAQADGTVLAGFAAVDITPQLNAHRIFLAGYGLNRKASGVHDPLYARAVVLQQGKDRIAIAAVDLIGLQYPQVKAIRARLPDFRFVLVASTHNHAGPDVIGIWGRGPFHRGADDKYLDDVVERVVQSIKEAAGKLRGVTAAYGSAEDESLLADSRLPIVKDGVLRVLRLNLATGGNTQSPSIPAARPNCAGIIVQWNCHPESLGAQNREITADFPWATVAALEKRYGCPVVYVSGAVGGLMSNPPRRIFDDGQEIAAGTFDYARRYGEAVADLASRAIASAEPIQLSPFVIAAKPISVPVQNSLYRTARALSVMKRDGFIWTGDFQSLGNPQTDDTADQPSAVESEVSYLRLGDLHMACIPGELYPELVDGKYPDLPQPGVDFPEVPLEPTITSLLPGPKWLLIGLANDELGYIIPKRQWDKSPPHAYGKESGQYGEINSCGPDVAPIIMQALKLRVKDAHLPRE